MFIPHTLYPRVFNHNIIFTHWKKYFALEFSFTEFLCFFYVLLMQKSFKVLVTGLDSSFMLLYIYLYYVALLVVTISIVFVFTLVVDEKMWLWTCHYDLLKQSTTTTKKYKNICTKTRGENLFKYVFTSIIL